MVFRDSRILDPTFYVTIYFNMKRNRSKTYSNERPTYFITTTVTEHTKIFFNDDLCKILLNNLEFYRNKLKFFIYGYVIMPNHIHLLLQQTGEKNISDFMRDFKKYTSVEIIRFCQKNDLQELLKVFQDSARKYMAKRDLLYQVWQERFDDVLIWSEKQFNVKLDYIHNNPVQEHWKLVDEPQKYKYSSARNYESGDDLAFRIDRLGY